MTEQKNSGALASAAMKKILPRGAVAGETFDPHYRAETAGQIPPSSEGVAFKAAA